MNFQAYVAEFFDDKMAQVVADLEWLEFCELLQIDETDGPRDPLDWLDEHDPGWGRKLREKLTPKVTSLLEHDWKEDER